MLLIALGGGGLLFVEAAATEATPGDAGPDFDIKVRSEVDKPVDGFKTKPPPAHGKVYLIISLAEVKNTEKLIRPVDETRLLELSRAELARRGYREVAPGETPNIVIVINYGRGYLRNVYTGDGSVNGATTGSPGKLNGYTDFGGGFPSLVITGVMPEQLIRDKTPNYNALLESANMEKLFLRVTAFKYPKPPGRRPELAWRTTMISDSPDYMDLNVIAPKMLTAGGSYFDKVIDRPEAIIPSDRIAERVEIGTPEVVADPNHPAKPGSK